MKKIVLLILSLLLLTACLTSCGDIEYDEAEVKAAAKELIEDSAVLNDILWGTGLPYYEDKNTSDGSYYRAIESYHYALGFKTIDELKELVAKTFTEEYCNSIYSTVLSGIQDGDDMAITSRYYQKVSSIDGTPEYIMVNSIWDRLLFGKVEYDYESLKVEGADGRRVYVTVNATVTEEGLAPQTREIRIALLEEDNGWRINNPTYLTYDKTNLNK